MKNHSDSAMREAWILCMILGMVMINFPFIHIFDDDMCYLVSGIPRIVLYFLFGWPASIAVIWLFVRRLEKEKPLNHEKKEGRSNL